MTVATPDTSPTPNGTSPRPPAPHPRDRALELLLAEDDPCQRLAYDQTLWRIGHRVESLPSGDLLLERLARRHGHVDLALVDWEMPGLCGDSLLQAVGWRWPALPVLVITAHSSEDRAAAAVGFAAGFLRKPFDEQTLLETVARTWHRWQRRRQSSSPGDAERIVRQGDLALHLDRLELQVRGGAPQRVTPSELRLLTFLMERPGEVVPRKVLARALEPTVSTAADAGRVLKHTLGALRRKVGDPPRRPAYLVSRWGKGVMLDPHGAGGR